MSDLSGEWMVRLGIDMDVMIKNGLNNAVGWDSMFARAWYESVLMGSATISGGHLPAGQNTKQEVLFEAPEELLMNQDVVNHLLMKLVPDVFDLALELNADITLNGLYMEMFGKKRSVDGTVQCKVTAYLPPGLLRLVSYNKTQFEQWALDITTAQECFPNVSYAGPLVLVIAAMVTTWLSGCGYACAVGGYRFLDHKWHPDDAGQRKQLIWDSATSKFQPIPGKHRKMDRE